MSAVVAELVSASARLGGRVVLDGVSLTLHAGRITALCGPNGAGKTSVMRALLGLAPLSGGRALLGGADVAGLGPRRRAELAAWLPQERRIAWNMPAVEIAALGAPFLDPLRARARALAALEEAGAAHLADRGAADMSGGERARVLLARALAAEGRALLADEPAAGLDPAAQLAVMTRLRARARGGQAVLVSLHDLTLAARFADRVLVLDHGRLAADDTPMAALSPEILARVFEVQGSWLSAADGAVLSLSPVSSR